MQPQNPKYAEIILPLPLPGTFTYEVPQGWKLEIGCRVAVQFGKKKLYTGIVHSFHHQAPEAFKTKPINAVLDKEPLVLEIQLQFWEWIAKYYCCHIGEVYKNAFPSALKLESDTFIKMMPNVSWQDAECTDEEYLLMEALTHRSVLSVQEAADILDDRTALPVIKTLIEKQWVQLDEKLIAKYTPKVEKYLFVDLDQADLSSQLMALQNAPKQREILLALITEQQQNPAPVRAADFVKKYQTTYATLRSLEQKKLISIEDLQSKRVKDKDLETQEIHQLTSAQQEAYEAISLHFKNYNGVLLHGVTASGKTEIYLKLIKDVVAQGKQVLYLLPEISLTTQLSARVQKHFGDKVGIYHSKFNPNERVELWQKTLQQSYDIVLGARSALFMPMKNIGLIIVDEEHETSLKQNDAKPYFHVRECVQVLAKMHNAFYLWGSATPSLEAYHAAYTQKIGYVALNQKYGNVQEPLMELIDLRKAYKEKRMLGNISQRLEKEIRETFEAQKQVIVFQNRRGYAPVMECRNCGHTPYCPNCDVALTYHHLSHQLKCHYCGHAQAKPMRCYQCKSTELEFKGLGTEQIEEEMQNLFKEKQVARMDVDSMRKKNAFEKLIDAFQNREVDMLVGTQMVTKGLDFEHVALVAIIRVDALLNFPDFRAHERAFQRIVQVAGRAGRRNTRGKVLIQTFQPDHQVLQNASLFDYHKTAKDILYERKNYLYPPFCRLIQLTFKHSKQEKTKKTAAYLAALLRPYFTEKTLLGPEAPSVAKLNNQYRYQMLIKILPNQSPAKVKKLILAQVDTLMQHKAFRAVKIDIDVDPY